MAKQHDNEHLCIRKAKLDPGNSYFCDSAIFNLDLPSIEKLTFIALSRYFTDADSAMPSNKALARDVGCSEERVALAVERLKEHVEFTPKPVIIDRNLQQ